MSENFFEGQRENETIVQVVRPYWVVLLPSILIGLFMALLPILFLVILSSTGSEPFTGTARNVTVVVLPIWYLILSTWLFIRWLDYYLDVNIITSERLIDIDQIGLFTRHIAELEYANIQDVSSQTNGFIQTIFHFGNVEVQTAGEEENFTLDNVHEPSDIARKISECREGRSQKVGGDIASQMAEAAEHMKEAAETIEEKTDGSSNQTASQPQPVQPPQETPPAQETQPEAPQQQERQPQQPPPQPQSGDESAPAEPKPDPEDKSGDLPREYGG
jgi:uncharacterized membrane protein YdbT with pleckstrin-like domain